MFGDSERLCVYVLYGFSFWLSEQYNDSQLFSRPSDFTICYEKDENQRGEEKEKLKSKGWGGGVYSR